MADRPIMTISSKTHFRGDIWACRPTVPAKLEDTMKGLGEEYPEKIYDVDYDWQQEQIARGL